MSAKPVPDGRHTVTPYLAIQNAAKALEFYKKAFGATETYKLLMPEEMQKRVEAMYGAKK
jgi:PhnB protein